MRQPQKGWPIKLLKGIPREGAGDSGEKDQGMKEVEKAEMVRELPLFDAPLWACRSLVIMKG